MSQGKLSPIFWVVVFRREWCSNRANGAPRCGGALENIHVLLHVRANGDGPVSLAMTHMRWLHGQSGHESTDSTLSVVLCVGGLQAWPINGCSNKDAGKSDKSRLDKTTLSKFTCVDNETFWKVNGNNTTQQHNNEQPTVIFVLLRLNALQRSVFTSAVPC